MAAPSIAEVASRKAETHGGEQTHFFKVGGVSNDSVKALREFAIMVFRSASVSADLKVKFATVLSNILPTSLFKFSKLAPVRY